LKDLTGPQPHLDHDDPDIPEHRGRRSQVLAFLIEGKRSFPSLFMQELHAPSEEGLFWISSSFTAMPRICRKQDRSRLIVAGLRCCSIPGFLEGADNSGVISSKYFLPNAASKFRTQLK